MKKSVTLIVCLLVLGAIQQSNSGEGKEPEKSPWQQWAKNYPDWVEKIEPFNLISNIYYVGTEGIASFLITSESGHVLIDGGLPQSADTIIENIASLGYKISDVKVLLNSHAHFDHSGGLAELKKRTGATMMASKQDAPYLKSGLYPGSNKRHYSAPPVIVDQQIEDGEIVNLGSLELKANITPGHTPGCTSWSMTVSVQGEPKEVLFFCSATVAGNRLINPPQYPGIVDDYRATFAKTKDWQPDVFLANHSFFFKLKEKREKQLSGDRLAFIDKESFPKLMVKLEQDFEKKLVQQQTKQR